MTALIEWISEPKRLVLAWEAPPFLPDRSRWAVGEIFHTPRGVAFRYYRAEEFRVLNSGRTEEALVSQGYYGYPAFDPNEKRNFFYSNVLEAFMRRLPPRSRTDYFEYLRHFGISSDANGLTPLAMLALTEARLPSDGFSLVDPLDPIDDICDFNIEIAGHRFYSAINLVGEVGVSLSFRAEPFNAYDPNAVQIFSAGQMIGYVNRIQAATFAVWIGHRLITASVSRLANSAYGQKLYAVVKVRPLGSNVETESYLSKSRQEPLRNYLHR